jgi:hypothetical protein
LSSGTVRGEGTIDELAAAAAASTSSGTHATDLEEVFLALT